MEKSHQNWLDNSKLIWNLAKEDFKKKNLGSYLGITWAFIQPTINILLLWFVFQVGFKSIPVDNFPFILWLATAMIPWNFFADSLQSSVHAITESSFLVKKVVFRVGLLPVVKILSSFYVHAFFLIFLFIMFLIYGYKPTLYLLQIPYYLVATLVLLLGLSWCVSALNVFLKDTGQIVTMVVQFGFWLTPIFYSVDIIPDRFLIFFKLNPMYYITEGYRRMFIYHEWFWEHSIQTLYFWIVAFVLLVGGKLIFKKLRPHFADVL